MVIGGVTDAVVSMLLLLVFLTFLSWYHRLRSEQFSGRNYDEGEEGLRKTQ